MRIDDFTRPKRFRITTLDGLRVLEPLDDGRQVEAPVVLAEAPGEGITFDDLDLSLEILNGWKMAAMEADVLLEHGAAPNNGVTKAIWGVRAPTGTRLQVKGGWDLAGQHFVDRDKRKRALEIGFYGFS